MNGEETIPAQINEHAGNVASTIENSPKALKDSLKPNSSYFCLHSPAS